MDGERVTGRSAGTGKDWTCGSTSHVEMPCRKVDGVLSGLSGLGGRSGMGIGGVGGGNSGLSYTGTAATGLPASSPCPPCAGLRPKKLPIDVLLAIAIARFDPDFRLNLSRKR